MPTPFLFHIRDQFDQTMGTGLPIVTAAVLLVISPLFGASQTPQNWCTPRKPCWPTDSEVAAFSSQLDPAASRVLWWPGGDAPRVCAVPVQSPDDQPLYGAGVSGMSPVYSWPNRSISNQTCYSPPAYHPDMCLFATRNTPIEGWQPGLTVWPLTMAHVQVAVQFARRHDMCIMVAGTGHDFLNRHSCPYGLFIRTALMKEMTFLPNGAQEGGEADGGAIRFGPGIVFSEAHEFAADVDRYVSSGWAITVGIVGWSLGGGHGPLAPAAGLGVDNIVEVELVGSEGERIVANRTHHPELLWALRGGGGSTWGVVTAITVRAHPIPIGGFTNAVAVWYGDLCPGSVGDDQLHQLIKSYSEWALARSKRFGGLAYFTSMKKGTQRRHYRHLHDVDGTAAASGREARGEPLDTSCGFAWELSLVYTFLGPPSDPEFTAALANFTDIHTVYGPNITNYATWLDHVRNVRLETISPVPNMAPIPGVYVGGMSSVLLSRSALANATTHNRLLALLRECMTVGRCSEQQLYHDLTGNTNSPQPAAGTTSVSSGLRRGIVHWVGAAAYNATETEQWFYSLGPHSYFAESPYEMPNWPQRYWGNGVYTRLQGVKRRYDPNGAFWCRHCVD